MIYQKSEVFTCFFSFLDGEGWIVCHRNNLLRAVKELRTVILSGWKSYELDAAVDMMEGKLVPPEVMPICKTSSN